jgi:hypothetical protein
MHYEYKVLQFRDKNFASAEVKWEKLEEKLNACGRDGWDVEHIQPLALGGGGSGVVVFLKRQVE